MIRGDGMACSLLFLLSNVRFSGLFFDERVTLRRALTRRLHQIRGVFGPGLAVHVVL